VKDNHLNNKELLQVGISASKITNLSLVKDNQVNQQMLRL